MRTFVCWRCLEPGFPGNISDQPPFQHFALMPVQTSIAYLLHTKSREEPISGSLSSPHRSNPAYASRDHRFSHIVDGTRCFLLVFTRNIIRKRPLISTCYLSCAGSPQIESSVNTRPSEELATPLLSPMFSPFHNPAYIPPLDASPAVTPGHHREMILMHVLRVRLVWSISPSLLLSLHRRDGRSIWHSD